MVPIVNEIHKTTFSENISVSAYTLNFAYIKSVTLGDARRKVAYEICIKKH